MNKKNIVESLWFTLNESSCDVEDLAERIIFDCGHDAGELEKSDLVAMFNGSYDKDWSNVAFAFNEVLTQYSCDVLSNTQFVQAVFVSLFFAEAVGHGAGDLLYTFDKIFDIVCKNRGRVDSEFIVPFFAEILGSDPDLVNQE